VSDFIVRRIIIACDAVSENRTGIEAAARLARSWNALLHAVFVQDESLLHLAALPFVRQVGAAGPETLDEAAMLRQFEADAERAHAALKAAARSQAVAWSFAVVRGKPSLAALSVGDRDLVVISATAKPFAGQFHLASRWLEAALETQLPVLVLHQQAAWVDGVVCAIRTTAPSSWRVLVAAACLALASNRPLIVRIVDDAVSADDVRKWLQGVSPDIVGKARLESVRPGQLLDEDQNRLVVVDAASDTNDLASLKELIERTQADILLVR